MSLLLVINTLLIGMKPQLWFYNSLPAGLDSAMSTNTDYLLQ